MKLALAMLLIGIIATSGLISLGLLLFQTGMLD